MITPDPDDVVMQYTGIKDKNGVEIYEGDIVRRSDGVTYAVVLEAIHYPANWPNLWPDVLRDRSDLDGRGEILGNIYESPELLLAA